MRQFPEAAASGIWNETTPGWMNRWRRLAMLGMEHFLIASEESQLF